LAGTIPSNVLLYPPTIFLANALVIVIVVADCLETWKAARKRHHRNQQREDAEAIHSVAKHHVKFSGEPQHRL
jgi:hypothetical protein